MSWVLGWGLGKRVHTGASQRGTSCWVSPPAVVLAGRALGSPHLPPDTPLLGEPLDVFLLLGRAYSGSPLGASGGLGGAGCVLDDLGRRPFCEEECVTRWRVEEEAVEAPLSCVMLSTPLEEVSPVVSVVRFLAAMQSSIHRSL